MGKVFENNAVCPFFQNSDEDFKVKCTSGETTVHLCFPDRRTVNKHMNTYCKNINGYKECPGYPVQLWEYKQNRKE